MKHRALTERGHTQETHQGQTVDDASIKSAIEGFEASSLRPERFTSNQSVCGLEMEPDQLEGITWTRVPSLISFRIDQR